LPRVPLFLAFHIAIYKLAVCNEPIQKVIKQFQDMGFNTRTHILPWS